MEPRSADIQATLDAIAAGELDALDPDQVQRVAAAVNADPALAARLAGIVPRVQPVHRAGVPQPSDAAWERVWQRIAVATVGQTRRRVLRLWRPALAAAACALLALIWNLGRAPAPEEWPVRWAQRVEINDLEVPAGVIPLVLVGESDGVPGIWVLDDQG